MASESALQRAVFAPVLQRGSRYAGGLPLRRVLPFLGLGDPLPVRARVTRSGPGTIPSLPWLLPWWFGWREVLIAQPLDLNLQLLLSVRWPAALLERFDRKLCKPDALLYPSYNNPEQRFSVGYEMNRPVFLATSPGFPSGRIHPGWQGPGRQDRPVSVWPNPSQTPVLPQSRTGVFGIWPHPSQTRWMGRAERQRSETHPPPAAGHPMGFAALRAALPLLPQSTGVFDIWPHPSQTRRMGRAERQRSETHQPPAAGNPMGFAALRAALPILPQSRTGVFGQTLIINLSSLQHRGQRKFAGIQGQRLPTLQILPVSHRRTGGLASGNATVTLSPWWIPFARATGFHEDILAKRTNQPPVLLLPALSPTGIAALPELTRPAAAPMADHRPGPEVFIRPMAWTAVFNAVEQLTRRELRAELRRQQGEIQAATLNHRDLRSIPTPAEILSDDMVRLLVKKMQSLAQQERFRTGRIG